MNDSDEYVTIGLTTDRSEAGPDPVTLATIDEPVYVKTDDGYVPVGAISIPIYRKHED